jgi:hypothetical protein
MSFLQIGYLFIAEALVHFRQTSNNREPNFLGFFRFLACRFIYASLGAIQLRLPSAAQLRPNADVR